MDFPIILLIGVSLAIDCFAVSLAAATSNRAGRLHLAIVLGTVFGVFQAGMLVLGWLAGSGMAALIGGIDHWVAFAILSLVGAKMIYGGLWGNDGREKPDYCSLSTLLILATATSIDALGVGISLGLLTGSILEIASVAGFISFLSACMGAMIGGALAGRFSEKIEAAGGVVLVAIGLKILIEHLSSPL